MAASAISGLKSIGATFINALGGMTISAGISLAITGIIKLADNIIHAKEKAEEAKQEIKDAGETAKQNIDQIKSDFDSLASTVDNVKQRYAELAQGVQNLGKATQGQGSLSNEEYAEFLDISNQLSDLFPQLTVAYDNNNNAILNLNGNVSDIVTSLNDLADAERQLSNYQISQEMPDIWSAFKINTADYADSYNDAIDKLDDYKDAYDTLIKYVNGESISAEYLNNPFFAELLNATDYAAELSDWRNKSYNTSTGKDQYSYSFINENDAGLAKKQIAAAYNSITEEYQAQKAVAQAQIQDANAEMASYALGVLSSSEQYNSLSRTNKSIFDSYVENIGYDTEKVNWDTWQDCLNDMYAVMIQLNDAEAGKYGEDIQNSYEKLLTLDANDITGKNIDAVKQMIRTIASTLNIDADSIASAFGIDWESADSSIQSTKARFGYVDEDSDVYKSASKSQQEFYDNRNEWINGLSGEDRELAAEFEISDEVLDYNASKLQIWFEEQREKAAIEANVVMNIDTNTAAKSAEDALGTLNTVLADYRANGITGIDISNLEALNNDESFANIDGNSQALERFMNVLHDVNATSEDVQNAFDDIASSYLYQSDLADKITAKNKDWIASRLEESGVVNAQAVAEQMLINKLGAEEAAAQACAKANLSLNGTKLNSSNASSALENAALSEIDQLRNESISLGETSVALAAYEWQKIQSTNAVINTDGDISNLSSLASALGVTLPLLQQYIDLKNRIENWSGSDIAKTEMEKSLQGLKYQIDTQIKAGSKANTSSGGYNSGASSRASNSTPSTSSNTSESVEETFSEILDWIEYRIESFQSKFDKWLSQAETALTSGFISSYYKKAASNSSSLMDVYDRAYDRYIKQADATGLSSEYKKLVQQGTIDISTITNEELKGQIEEYQTYWNKAQEMADSFLEEAGKFYNLPLDEAATKIEKFNDAIDLLDATLANIKVDDYKTANKNIDSQIAQQKKILTAQNAAKTKADSNFTAAKTALNKSDMLNSTSGITAAEKKKIQTALKNNQEIDLSLFKSNSDGYNAAVKYNEALKARTEATREASLAQQEYTSQVRALQKQKFDNIQNYYDNRVKLLDNQISSIDNQISEIEAAGKKVTKSYYESQKTITASIKKKYESEKTALEKQLANITEGTEEWYDAKDAIQECADSISECVRETYELNNAINELHFDMFNDIAESIDRIVTEQEFLQSLFAHEDLTDSETGTFTNAGLAKLGSLSASYYASKEKTDNDAAEVKELQRMLNSNTLSSKTLGITFNSVDNLKEKLNEMYTQWQNDIKDTYSLESEINSLMQDKYQAELDLLKELIDSKQEALDAEKDLHDYRQSIQEKTNDISTIRKQIAAYGGDTSQEGLARLQKLQVELSEKEEELRETEYDQYISDQKDMLDKLYEEYEELVTKKLDDFMGLVREGLNTSNANTAVISAYLSSVATANGYTEETKGLFTTVSGSIGESTVKIISAIENSFSVSGTASGTSQATGSTSTASASSKTSSTAKSSAGTSALSGSFVEEPKLVALPSIDEVKEFIKGSASKATKAKSKYTDVNQIIYENKAKAYEGTGRVLSSSQLRKLASMFHVDYDNGNSGGNLYKALKSISFPGFKKGGVIKVDDIEKQVNANGDDVLISAKSGESLLTPLQTAQFSELVSKLPELNQMVDILQPLINLPEMPDIQPVGNGAMTNNIEATYNFTLDNCTNADDIIRQIQQNTKVQKALQSVTTDRLAGGGKLSVNKIR